jgi:regulator of RNase E activity RraA
MSKLALERGVSGLVVDGAVRDADAIEELGFPVFAAGIVPTPPGRDVIGEVGVEIECAGRQVSPGDYVYGDGVVVVSAAVHDEVVARALDVLAAEKA